MKRIDWATVIPCVVSVAVFAMCAYILALVMGVA
jgi:hypothetical protein